MAEVFAQEITKLYEEREQEREARRTRDPTAAASELRPCTR
jgi:hypothetical protein